MPKNILFGILAIVLTILFQFVGTFISRLLFAKLPIEKVIYATLAHFVALFFLFIPVFGLIIYIVIELVFIYKNFVLTSFELSKD
ncbi:hypothetical protein AAX26_01643 [Aliarcobacter thereius]|uniref:hypothetical protein n=1 Tax=Aliarcobacter thereius TaxID=544718 RepID=UPI000829275A|nr:hypothetical protein [Aliarcobacter thereius]OCL85993.1 hypothetical protein AAX26_01643 [Aliarcobacter thereius]